MEVKLIDYQKNALDLLLYTKSTRIGGKTLKELKDTPLDEKLEHLAYMRDTIKSSWEFVKYTFEIKGVSRAFTHQLVRTRTQSYAQESQRTIDASNNGFVPTGCTPVDQTLHDQMRVYTDIAKDSRCDIQDCRAILPTNVKTNIIVGTDLRTLNQTALVRLCVRTQGEYQSVFKAMKAEVVAVHPYFADFIEVNCVQTGACAFPRYKECPIQKYTHVSSVETKRRIANEWGECNHVANPVAKDGRTM